MCIISKMPSVIILGVSGCARMTHFDLYCQNWGHYYRGNFDLDSCY